MKRLITLFSLLALIGCTTLGTWQTSSGKFLATTATTVDSAMQAWATFVVAGRTTAAQEAKVKALYIQYQSYMMIATNSYALAVKIGDPSYFTAASNNLFYSKEEIVGTTISP
jgi:uncharacterized membrane protein YjgN (DUF898 family)